MKKKDPEVWGPPGFVAWMRQRPSDVSGEPPPYGRLNEVHHEPTRGSRRAHWTRTCTLTTAEHTAGPGARHGLNSGVETFWKKWGKDPDEVCRAVQEEWKRFEGNDLD